MRRNVVGGSAAKRPVSDKTDNPRAKLIQDRTSRHKL